MSVKKYALILCLCLFGSGILAENKKMVFSTFDLGLFNEVNEKIFVEVYRRLNIAIDIQKYPAERAIWLANNGDVDGDLSRKAIVAELYKNLIKVPTAYHQAKTVVFSNRDDIVFADLDNLKNYRVAILRGYKIAERLTKKLSVFYIEKPEQLFYLLDRHRVDVVIYSEESGLAYISILGLKNIKILNPAVESAPVYHFLNKKHADLVPKVDEVIKQMMAEGLPDKIAKDVFSKLNIESLK